MTTQISPNAALPIPQTGDPSSSGTWGVIQGTGVDMLDGLICAVESVPVGGNINVVLTFSAGNLDQTDAAHFDMTGVLTGDVVVLWPNGRQRMFSCTNNTTGAHALSFGVNNGAGIPAGTTQSLGPGLTGQYLSDGTNILPRASGGITGVSRRYFGTAGVFTYTPTAGTLFAIVRMRGNGAGGYEQVGGNFGGGGGGEGEDATDIFTAAQIGVSQTITIPNAAAVSTNGATVSFGALLTAAGGSTGFANDVRGGAGGSGGIGSGSSTHTPGADGSNGAQVFPSPSYIGTGGTGANGGRGGTGPTDAGRPGRAPGSGGGGNGVTGAGGFGTAGIGAVGFVEIIEFH